jgi:ADP-heptose:LPS heptosyltransferase
MAAPTGYIKGARPIDSWVGLVICALLFAWSRLLAFFGGPRLAPMRATTPPQSGQPTLHPRRILGIKSYGLGNIVMLLPVLQSLRQAFPDAEVDFLTFEENRTLLERSGLVSHAIGIDMTNRWTVLASLVAAFRTIRARRYDVVLDFEQFIKLSAIVAYLSGAPHRVGFNTDGQRRAWLYTTRVVYTDSDHMSRIFMRILRGIGVSAAPSTVHIATTPGEESRVEELLRAAGVMPGQYPLIAVHVGSGPNFYQIPLKRWPVENFARLCDALAERHDATIVLTGKGPEERALIDQALGLMRRPAIDLCDQLSVLELVALLERCHFAVANDTSVMHLAAAIGTPVVAFFGPTAPLHYGPGAGDHLVFYRDLYCSPCLTNYNLKVSRCTDPVCIRSITVDEVLAGIEARFLAPHAPLRSVMLARTLPPAERRVAAG